MFASIATSFHLPNDALRELLLRYDSVLAGHAALTGYLEQEGKTGFDAPSMQIWIHNRHPHWNQPQLDQSPTLHPHHQFTTFLKKNNYVDMEHVAALLTGEAIAIPKPHNGMTRSMDFCHPLGKMVRLLFVVDKAVKPAAVLVRSEFNVEDCWYDQDDDTFKANHPESILRKQIYRSFHEHIPSLESLSDCQRGRIEFYLSHGFTMGEKTCEALHYKDPRNMTASILHGTKAFDVFAYDEIDAVAFLEESSWNILLKTGDKFHAFHRQTLIDYMDKHSSSIIVQGRHTRIFDTPYHHSISFHAFRTLKWSDYSIVELTPSITIEIEGQTKSIMDVNFYTVAHWNCAIPSYSVKFLS